MSLHHHLRGGIHTVDAGCSLAHVARCLRDFDTSALLVTDPGIRVVKGIVTKADLLDAVAAGCDSSVVKVGDLTPTEVPLVNFADLDAARIDRLKREGWQYVALVDDRMRPLGLLAIEEAEKSALLEAA